MVEKTEEVIPKKIAALELYKTNKKIFLIGLISIIAVFIVSITSISYKMLGATLAGITSIILAWFIVTARKNMLYFNEKYDLGYNHKKK